MRMSERIDNAISTASVAWAAFVRGYLDSIVENMNNGELKAFEEATGVWIFSKKRRSTGEWLFDEVRKRGMM